MNVSPLKVHKLTVPQIRVLFEGKRVDNLIEREVTRIQDAGGVEDAKGTVVPRESDLAMLEEFERETTPKKN